MTRKLRTYFDPETEFETPLLEGGPLRDTFNGLQETLVNETLDMTDTLALHEPLRRAANEAAGLAWTTAYPLLVFPALFNEKADRVRRQEQRALRIKAQSAELLMEAAV